MPQKPPVSAPNLITLETTSLTPRAPCLPSSTSTTSKVLRFQKPDIVSAPKGRPVPPYDASFADDLQWLALERPLALDVVKYLVKGIIAKHRPAPLPAMIATLTAGLEYVAIDVNDTRALVAPIEGRLGRRMSDVVPAVLMEAFDRKLCAARKSRRPQVFPYQGPSGYHWNVRILMPTPDIIVTNVTEDRRTAAADRRRTPPPYTELEST